MGHEQQSDQRALQSEGEHTAKQKLPLGTITGEQDVEAFVEALQQNGEQLLEGVQAFLQRPNKTPADLALGIYLDAIVKQDVLGRDPFGGANEDGEEVQADREMIAFIAGEWVGKQWLVEHPESKAAHTIAQMSILAPSKIQCELLQEMWPHILQKLD